MSKKREKARETEKGKEKGRKRGREKVLRNISTDLIPLVFHTL